jgi:hypothetical protein
VGVASSHDIIAASCRSHTKVNIIDFDCVVLPGLNAVANGLDYNLSRLFNQDMLAASL